MKAERPAILRYVFSLLAIALAIAGRAWAERMGWGPYRFPFLQFAVIVSSLVGGLGPGMFAVALSTLAWLFFLPPAGRLWVTQPVDALNLATFAGINTLIVWAFATAREKWTKPAARNPHDARLDVTPTRAERPRISVASPLTLAGLGAVVLALGVFGWWGTFSPSGMAHFDDEATLIPLTCLGLAPALLIFGIGFLPVLSFSPRTPRPESTAAPGEASRPVISPGPR